MELDEAIKHCEEKACGCDECSNEHRQLAEWLKELKQFRQPEVDFETEYAKFSNDPDALDYAFPVDLADYKDFARHFWNKGYNARNK